MNTLKPLVTIAVLAALGYFVYDNINGRSAENLSGDLATLWGDAPTVATPDTGGAAPAFGASAADGPPAFRDLPPEAGAGPSSTSSVPLPGTTSVPAGVPTQPAATVSPAVSSDIGGSPVAALGGLSATNPAAAGPPAIDRAVMNRAAISPSTMDGATTSPPAASATSVSPPTLGATADSPPSIGSVGGGVVQGTTTGQSASVADATIGQAASGTTAPVVPSASTAYAALRSAVQISLDRGEYAEPLSLLSSWYGDPSLTPIEKAELVDLLGQLAGTVIYSSEHHLETAHIVQPGETLQSIGEKFQVPWQLLAKINGKEPTAGLNAGRELKVIRGPFSAVISLGDRELTLMLGSRYAGRFAIGIGQDGRQIEGRWIVQQKQNNPTYYGRDRTIDADNPENPLGEHMLGLTRPNGAGVMEVFGIHGTNDPGSIERDDPRGFIRLAPAAAEDVFDILSVGSNVIIRR